MAEILVVGAGPVGLTLAGELARHGARCRIVDQLPQPSPYCRAIGVTPRTLEVWEDMGVARDAIDAGLRLRGLRSIVDGRPPIDAFEDHSHSRSSGRPNQPGRAHLRRRALFSPLSTPEELGGAGDDDTNPEQLFVAGYSACFIGG